MSKEFKIYKSGDFTVMSNYHLKDKSLSLKAVGLLSKMLSLPEDWDYSLNGLVSITKDGLDSVRNALNELKDHNYVEILKIRTAKGTFRYRYLVFENPSEKALKLDLNPDMEKPYLDKPNTDTPDMEKHGQYNNKEYNNNNIKDKIDKREQPNDESESIPISHNILTLELIQMNYVNENSPETFFYDDLFKSFLEKGKSYKQLYSVVHYIVDRVKSRSYIDEEGNDITNRFGYLKKALESNFSRFDHMPDELYPSDKDILSDNWLEMEVRWWINVK